jgi:hypothetical protein
VRMTTGVSAGPTVLEDLNKDGNLDVATLVISAASVSVFTGNGQFGFTSAAGFSCSFVVYNCQPPGYLAGPDQRRFPLADFNGDGKPDLAHNLDAGIGILRGDGGGGFTRTGAFGGDSIVVDDLNGDSKLDLAVTGGNSQNTVKTALGTGLGGFSTPVTYTAGPAGTIPTPCSDEFRGPEFQSPFSGPCLASGDFSGEGNRDLVVPNEVDSVTPGYVSRLLGNGAGGVGSPLSLPLPGAPTSVATGDFNGDSKDDFVVAYNTNGTAHLEVQKSLPSGDPGLFNLRINGQTTATSQNVGNGGTTGSVAVAAGFNRVDETAGTGTSLNDYTSSITCRERTSGTVVGSGPGPDMRVELPANSDVVCTITNTYYLQHPVGASPLRVSLVPAFQSCMSSNSTHGAPLNFPSCSPPSPASSTVNTGSGSSGSAWIIDCNTGTAVGSCNEGAGGFTSAMQPDVRVFGAERDVQCRLTGTPSGCSAGQDYNPNGASGPYTATCTTATSCGNNGKPTPFCAPGTSSSSACIAGTDVTLMEGLGQPSSTTVNPTTQCGSNATCLAFATKFVGHGLRVTDQYNCAPGLPAGDPNACPASSSTSTRAATLVDIRFPVPLDCLATASAALGSTCGLNTTLNAVVPGTVVAGKKSIVEVGEIELRDSGPDGTRGNSDDQRFAVEGIYLP